MGAAKKKKRGQKRDFRTGVGEEISRIGEMDRDFVKGEEERGEREGDVEGIGGD